MNEIIDRYKHLNDDDTVPFSIPETAKILIKLNYGQQRLLAELVKLREASEEYTKYPTFKRQTDDLRKLLETGWF